MLGRITSYMGLGKKKLLNDFPLYTSTCVITSLSHPYQNIGDHRSGKTKEANNFSVKVSL